MTDFPLSAGRDREMVRHETKRRTLTVIRRAQLTDTLVRFTFTSDDHFDGFVSLGPEDHVKVFFPAEDVPAARDYTPGDFRPGGADGAELDLDFVVHGDAGPATAWASNAEVGTELEIGGPRGSRLAPSGFRNVVLVADASGTPALRRWLLAYQGVSPVKAILFGPDARLTDYFSDHERQLAGIEESWTDESKLLDRVTGQDIDGDTFVWAAGEANALIPIRSWLKNEKGLGAPNLSLHGYWRAGEAALGDHAPIDPSDPD